MSAQALTTEATKRCNACGEEFARSGFSSKQWKARQMRRCTACTETGREMRAHDVAPAADALDVAEAAAALPSQGPLLDSLAALGVSSGGSEDSRSHEVYSDPS